MYHMLANGRTYLAIPGPSVMPDRVLGAMHRASPNIYTGELHEVTHSLIPDLRSLAMTSHQVAIYIGNGHAAWEASLANVCNRGDKVLVLGTGRFCLSWGGMASDLGLVPQIIDFGDTSDIDVAQVEEALRADTTGEIKAILAVHVDTSTGVLNDIAALRAAMDASGHNALLMVDCIASLGCDRFEMDAWGVDVMVSACQKGLMTPPGLGFVFFNDKAQLARGKVDIVSQYWDWTQRADPQEYWQYFDGTAPTHHIYGLREALDMIAEEGLDAVFDRHKHLAQSVWAAIDAWAGGGSLRINIADPAKRSHAITSLAIDAPDGDRLRDWCETQAGVTLGIGLGRDPASGFFRLGHMGHVNAQMVMAVLGVMDAGFKALDIPHGAGALEAASAVIAKAS